MTHQTRTVEEVEALAAALDATDLEELERLADTWLNLHGKLCQHGFPLSERVAALDCYGVYARALRARKEAA